MRPTDSLVEPSLAEIAREWGRIGCIGFGGPPAHIALFRELCVTRRGWLAEDQFERAIAATNLLPGPASTQLAIYCAWRLRGTRGALIGGLGFILPGLVLILALSVLFLASSPPASLLRFKCLQNPLPRPKQPHLQGVLVHVVNLFQFLQRKPFHFLHHQQDPVFF